MAQADFAKRGIDVAGVTLNLGNMMKQKEDSVKALTSGIVQLSICTYSLLVAVHARGCFIHGGLQSTWMLYPWGVTIYVLFCQWYVL